MTTNAHAARFRWRADLLDFHAAYLPEWDTTRDQKTAEAALCRAYGAQVEEYDAAKASGDRAAIKAAANDIREFRRVWREIGEAVGTRGAAAVVNGFSEPSDSELVEG